MRMTKELALELCLVDWKNLAAGAMEKMLLPDEAYRGLPHPHNDCFCCEYTRLRLFSGFDGYDSCSICPLNGFAWEKPEEPTKIMGIVGYYQCEEDPNSPYKYWCDLDDRTPSGREWKKFYAAKMVTAIEEALAYEGLRQMNEV